LLTYILYGMFILACIILVVVILLQPGKADAGALFSNTVSSTAFGPRGTASLLAKITIGAAAAFMLIALTHLQRPPPHHLRQRNRCVLS
jgi:preprotein translocase subunit SecG